MVPVDEDTPFFFDVSRCDREIDVEADRERILATLSQSPEKCGDPGVTVRLPFARPVNLGNQFSDTSAQIAFESQNVSGSTWDHGPRYLTNSSASILQK